MLLNEEQRILQQTIKEFLDANSPVEDMRTLRDHPIESGFKSDLWQQMVELGVSGLGCAEEFGGFGFGYLGLGAIMEEMGRHLTASPLFSSVVLASSIIESCGDNAQKSLWLSNIAAGESTFAVAIDEGHHFNPTQTSTSLDGDILNGKKVFVMDASGADTLLVLARNSEADLVWCIVDKSQASLKRHSMMDGRDMCSVAFENVTVAADRVILAPWSLSEYALDKATIALSAEMLGGARELLERTVKYLSEREQFDVKIGSFQALQHRCAQMFCQLELAQSAVQKGLASIDYGIRDLANLASQIKCLANDCYQHISNESVQLHGGMGITDELEIGLFLKRARVCMQLLGDSNYHKNRFAQSLGF